MTENKQGKGYKETYLDISVSGSITLSWEYWLLFSSVSKIVFIYPSSQSTVLLANGVKSPHVIIKTTVIETIFGNIYIRWTTYCMV